MSKRLLVVFGATGNQGGSTANFVLDNLDLSEKYSVRAITRSASNKNAQDLASKGAEIVEADLDKPETLPKALKGAHTVFAVTNTQYGGNSREIETRQAKAVCEEALKQGAQYIIWSSMSHPLKITEGKLKNVEHFDVKAEIEQYIRGLPVQSAFVAPGCFMQNFLGPGMTPRPSPANDGTYVLGNLCRASTKLPMIDITDTGKWVGAILAEPDKYAGKFFAAAEGIYTFEECAQILSKVTGKKVVYQQLPDDVQKGFFPQRLREALYEMWVLNREYGYYGKDMESEVQWAKEQARGRLTSLEEFLKKVEYKLE